MAFLEKVLDDDYSTRLVNRFMRSVTAYDLDPEAKNIGPGTINGGKRYLQYTSRTELFWEHVAWAENQGAFIAFFWHFLL